LRFAALFTFCAAAVLGSASDSSAAAPKAGPELEAWRKVVRYDVQFPATNKKAGAARANVDAPPAVVRSVVLDYKNYASFITKFEKSHVVGKSGDKTDVYLQVPIMKGVAKVWAVVRFEPPKTVGDEEIVTGRMIKGNVKRLDAKWRIKKIDENTTKLECELLIVPEMPLPDSLVIGELKFAAAKAVGGSRGEAERRHAKH
jgi:ribosome-associated toxin RatA of RatAB toxin-antitoxin module